MDGWERVKKVIEHFGLNKNSFSKEIGLSNNVTIGRIINERRKPSEITLTKIAARFNTISIEWLKTGNGKMIDKKQNESEIYLKKGTVEISIDEISGFIVNNEDEFMKVKGFKNMVELIVAKRLLVLLNNPEKIKEFLKN